MPVCWTQKIWCSRRPSITWATFQEISPLSHTPMEGTSGGRGLPWDIARTLSLTVYAHQKEPAPNFRLSSNHPRFMTHTFEPVIEKGRCTPVR